MGRQLVFWKYEDNVRLDDKKVYEKICDQEDIDGLLPLPINEILLQINSVFSRYNKLDDYNFESANGSFTLYITERSVIFDCSWGLPEAELNKMIDIMNEFGCPLYDPQIEVRFKVIKKEQSIKDKLKDLDKLMAQKLEPLGFKRCKRFWYQRMQGECLQHIYLSENKVPGKEQCWIQLNFALTFEEFSKIMVYLQGYSFDKYVTTVQNNIINVMYAKDKLHYNLYLTDTSNTEEVADYLIGLMDRYVVPYWDAYGSFEKFAEHYENGEKSFGFPDEEWFHLTIALMQDTDSYKDVMERYHDRFELMQNKRFGDIEARIQAFIQNGGIPK